MSKYQESSDYVDFDYIVTKEGVAIYAIRGEAWTLNYKNFRSAFLGGIDGGETKVTVDLTDATYIDSSFLGVLVAGAKRLPRPGMPLTMVMVKADLLRLFEITALDRVMSIFPTRQAALDSF
jgi:anti-sigma B factor antagonist